MLWILGYLALYVLVAWLMSLCLTPRPPSSNDISA